MEFSKEKAIERSNLRVQHLIKQLEEKKWATKINRTRTSIKTKNHWRWNFPESNINQLFTLEKQLDIIKKENKKLTTKYKEEIEFFFSATNRRES